MTVAAGVVQKFRAESGAQSRRVTETAAASGAGRSQEPQRHRQTTCNLKQQASARPAGGGRHCQCPVWPVAPQTQTALVPDGRTIGSVPEVHSRPAPSFLPSAGRARRRARVPANLKLYICNVEYFESNAPVLRAGSFSGMAPSLPLALSGRECDTVRLSCLQGVSQASESAITILSHYCSSLTSPS